MIITRDMVREKLLADLEIFKSKTTVIEGKTLPSEAYYPKYEALGVLINSRTGWFANREAIANVYRQIATFFYGKMNDKNRSAMAHNYVELIRRAAVIESFGPNDATVSIAQIDEHLWTGAEIQKAVLTADFQAIHEAMVEADKKGKNVKPVITVRANDPKAAEEEQKAAAAQKKLEAQNSKKKVSLSSLGGKNFGYVLLFLAVFIAFFSLLWFGQDYILPLFGFDQPATQVVQPVYPQTDQALPVTPVTPETAPIVDAPLSSDLVATRESMALVWEMLRQTPFWLLVLVGVVALLYKIFSEAQDRADRGDFPIVATIISSAFVLSILPIFDFLFPGSQTLLLRGGYVITMHNLQNFIILLGAGTALWAAARNGVEDYTPLSGGLFVVGIIFFITQPSQFMAWRLPYETIAAWGLAAIVQVIEIGRQHHAKVALVITVIGIVGQLAAFFLIVAVLESTANVGLVKWSQEVAFVLSMILVTMIANFLLGPLANQKLVPLDGVLSGDLTRQIQTASHDVVIMLLMWGAFFLTKFWV